MSDPISQTPAFTRPDITERLALYWRTYADLPSRALHPETPLYTHGMLIEDTRDARLEIERLRTTLRSLRGAFSNENGLNAMSIVDTVWVSDIETALDCIDAALKESDRG